MPRSARQRAAGVAAPQVRADVAARASGSARSWCGSSPRRAGLVADRRALRRHRRAAGERVRRSRGLDRRLRHLGGELPAMVVIDCIVRRLPGSLNDAGSATQDSFSAGLLDWPHYTRPEEWNEREGARRAAVGQPRGDRALAPQAGAGAHVGTQAGPARRGRALAKEDRQLLDEYRREQQAAQQQQ